MSVWKRIFFMAVILTAAVLCTLIYWNQHLVYEAEDRVETEERIAVLEKAARIYPWNDLVFYELGKAYHDLGVSSLGEEDRRGLHVQKSIGQFRRSLRINPTSYFGHFYLARSFQNMSFDDSSYGEKAREEYKKAAMLAGRNVEVLYEVGKVFLSQWPSLSGEDREFTLSILNRVVEGKDRERIQSLFIIWEINGEDYEVMDRMLHEDPQIYRYFAEFLGERSLSLEERLKYLSGAEFMEFQRAKDAFEKGDSALFYFRLKEAQSQFKSCLDILAKIHFYQDISALQNRIDPVEFEELEKKALLNLVKSRLERGEEIKDVEDVLWRYLEKEGSAAAIGELEIYLRGKGLGKEATGAKFDDLGRLSLELYLSLKEGRFRDNMSVGRDIMRSFGVVPEGQEERFVKILEIVAESFQRVDFIYDSIDFYNRALEWDPENLEILVRLRRNYERLSANAKILEIDSKIQEIVSPQEMEVGRTVNKRGTYRQSLVLDGRKIDLGLHFGKGEEKREPLISVFYNGRVVWEDYLEGDTISIELEPILGENMIQIVPVNRRVELTKITYSVL